MRDGRPRTVHIFGRIATGQWPENGLGLAASRTGLSLAFLQRCDVVLGVAEVRVGTVGEQPPDACRPAVARCRVQGQPPPFGIGFVDGGSGLNELIDHVQPLVVGCEDQRADPALDGEPAQRPGAASPAAAAISRLSMRAPAATRTSMTSVIPNTAAWPSAVLPGTPPESGAEMASMSAPASVSTLATSASPELAAVIRGVWSLRGANGPVVPTAPRSRR